MKSLCESVEDAILALVEAALGIANETTGYLRAVLPYNGEFESEEGLVDLRRRTSGQYPAVLIGAGESAYTSKGINKRRFSQTLRVEVFSVGNNLRSREARQRNDASHTEGLSRDPGLYAQKQNLHQLISGADLGVEGAGPPVPVSEKPIYRTAEMTVWLTAFDVDVDAHVEPWSVGDGQALTSYFLESHDAETGVDVEPNPIVTSEGDFE